jgi:hypothetical protein
VQWQLEAQLGGADGSGEVGAPQVGPDQIVEHPQGRLVHAPRAKLQGGIHLQARAAGKRIEQDRRSLSEVADDVVARQPHARQPDIRPARHLDVDHGEQDRQAAAALEHEIEHGVVGVVVLIEVAHEPVVAVEHLSQRFELVARLLTRLAGELRPQSVELSEGSGPVNLLELRGKGERQLVEGGVRLGGKVGKGLHAHNPLSPSGAALPHAREAGLRTSGHLPSAGAGTGAAERCFPKPKLVSMRSAQTFEEDGAGRQPDIARRPPEPPRTGNKYAWAVAIVMVMCLGVLLLTTTLPNTGSRPRGLAPDKVPPAFAAPLATGRVDCDADAKGCKANVCQRRRECNGSIGGSTPACELRSESVFNVCVAREKPLVLTFLSTRGADCEPQVDRVERMRREFPGVGFAAVFGGEDRADVEQIVRRRGWHLPVAFDKDGAVLDLYGVGVCPTTVLSYAGGKVRTTKLGNLTEEQLRAEVRGLVRR